MATVEEFLHAYPAGVQATARALMALVREIAPDATEKVYTGWQLIGYRVPVGKRTRYCCFVAPMPDHVKLGFEHGVELHDPEGLLEGRGTQMRQVIIRTTDGIGPDLLGLIAQAVDLERGRG